MTFSFVLLIKRVEMVSFINVEQEGIYEIIIKYESYFTEIG